MFTITGLFRATFVIALAATTAGCEEHQHHAEGHEHEEPNAAACSHLEKGPAVAITAAATSSKDAPRIDNNHSRYDVTLVDVAGGKGGFVSIAARKATDYIIFADQPVRLTVMKANQEVAAESSQPSIPECTTVKGRHAYPLGIDTYEIGISGATSNKVSLIVEVDDHH